MERRPKFLRLLYLRLIERRAIGEKSVDQEEKSPLSCQVRTTDSADPSIRRDRPHCTDPRRGHFPIAIRYADRRRERWCRCRDGRSFN